MTARQHQDRQVRNRRLSLCAREPLCAWAATMNARPGARPGQRGVTAKGSCFRSVLTGLNGGNPHSLDACLCCCSHHGNHITLLRISIRVDRNRKIFPAGALLEIFYSLLNIVGSGALLNELSVDGDLPLLIDVY